MGAGGGVCLRSASDRGPAYLYSVDGGSSFLAAETTPPIGRSQVDIEQFAGHNLPVGPAPFVVATQTREPDPEHFWRRVDDLDL